MVQYVVTERQEIAVWVQENETTYPGLSDSYGRARNWLTAQAHLGARLSDGRRAAEYPRPHDIPGCRRIYVVYTLDLHRVDISGVGDSETRAGYVHIKRPDS